MDTAEGGISVNILDDLAALADTITERGIPAVLDPRDLTVPGALVDLDTIGGQSPTLCGLTEATATVYLVAPDNGRPETLTTLLDAYAAVADLTSGAEPIDLALPNYGTLPALRLNPIQLGD